MRKVPYVRAESAVPMAEFNIHIAPQANASAPPPAASAGCDPRKCPWWPYTNAKEFKANTALILVVLFCALICALAFNAAIRYLIRLHCGGGRRRGDQKEEIGGGAAEEEAEVPALIFAEGMKLAGGETECIICLSEFAAGDKIRVLDRCSHGFHLECVQRWLASRSSCPTCRANCASEEANESTP